MGVKLAYYFTKILRKTKFNTMSYNVLQVYVIWFRIVIKSIYNITN